MLNMIIRLLGGSLSAAPKWFSGFDCVFELLAVVVTLLISAYIYQFYRFNRQEKYFWLSLSFLALAIAFLSRVFTNSFLYARLLERYASTVSAFTLNIIHNVNWLYILGHVGFRVLTLAGLIGIYLVLESSNEAKSRTGEPFSERISKKHLFLFLFLATAMVLFSMQKYVVFYVTAALLLAFIAYVTLKNYSRVRSKSGLLISAAFLTLMASQMVFIFIAISSYAYVVAEVIQLVGFGILLAGYYKLKHAVKNEIRADA